MASASPSASASPTPAPVVTVTMTVTATPSPEEGDGQEVASDDSSATPDADENSSGSSDGNAVPFEDWGIQFVVPDGWNGSGDRDGTQYTISGPSEGSQIQIGPIGDSEDFEKSSGLIPDLISKSFPEQGQADQPPSLVDLNGMQSMTAMGVGYSTEHIWYRFHFDIIQAKKTVMMFALYKQDDREQFEPVIAAFRETIKPL